ncbi:short-chain dehydrogenase [Bacillus sp. AFS002410]|uniref:SDR family NAD(P)-dependent oxidoreductase n=1 Tax=Bacillus sp. AFS002410 TaxID=2033481 RepID=UPI000BEFB99B|nr:SDR family oxidoreductase [Bacillus sp. AFS002410]PEJ58389.1 short-chain dehydrogenase [Bacillus sp. AFS002410]
MTLKNQKRKTVLITGATNGIGFELTKLFAKDQFNLILVARNRNKLEEMAISLMKQFSIKVLVISEDLSQASSAKSIADQVLKSEMEVDLLINNAGVALYGNFGFTDLEKELNMIQLNIVTLTELVKYFLPTMLQNKSGQIINIASTAAFQPGPLMSVYAASKAYVLSFSEALSEELKHTGVSVTTICPGPTKTGIINASGGNKSKLFQGKMMSPRKVAKLTYEAIKKEKTVVVTGLKNKILAQAVRFIPRTIVRKLARKLLDEK